ncbi:MAG TPA: hypothetical protein PLZ84_02110 [Clostridia bacterium]|nr:hypothetical protein [Clostridia bacterium]
MSNAKTIRDCFEKNNGILRLAPTFVPRRFGSAGHRLKLHPDDYFALGTHRGSIKERWFSSVIPAMNGPLAAPDEGMSYVDVTGRVEDKILFKDFVDLLGAEIIGKELYDKYGTWPMYSKFFDYEGPLFHHVHLDFEAASRVGKLGKPEAYYFPRQLNNYPGKFPHTYFGFDPDCTKEQVKERLRGYLAGDTRITELSRAYRIELGTGWYTPAGVIHAPGSYLTYEPQWNSDVNSVYENVCDNEIYDKSFLNENCPDDKKEDLDYILNLLDWEKNVDPHYKKHYFRPPLQARKTDQFEEKWISYGNEYIAAKELTVYPRQSVVIKDDFAYGCILVQGNGRMGNYKCETSTMLRFGQLSQDEYFVSEKAAKEGVLIANESEYEPLVILKHFPANAQTPAAL